MPSRVCATTPYRPAASARQHDRDEHPVHRVAHQLAEREGAGQPGRCLHAVHVVADQQPAQLLEDEDQRIGHQHLLQVLALVEEAEEGPLQQVAEQHRQQHAHGQAWRRSRRRRWRPPAPQREGHVGADHVEAAVRQVDDAHDAEDQRQPAGHEEQQQAVLHARSGTGRGRWRRSMAQGARDATAGRGRPDPGGLQLAAARRVGQRLDWPRRSPCSPPLDLAQVDVLHRVVRRRQRERAARAVDRAPCASRR